MNDEYHASVAASMSARSANLTAFQPTTVTDAVSSSSSQQQYTTTTTDLREDDRDEQLRARDMPPVNIIAAGMPPIESVAAAPPAPPVERVFDPVATDQLTRAFILALHTPPKWNLAYEFTRRYTLEQAWNLVKTTIGADLDFKLVVEVKQGTDGRRIRHTVLSSVYHACMTLEPPSGYRPSSFSSWLRRKIEPEGSVEAEANPGWLPQQVWETIQLRERLDAAKPVEPNQSDLRWCQAQTKSKLAPLAPPVLHSSIAARNMPGWSGLYSSTISLQKLLEVYGLDPNEFDSEGRTALHFLVTHHSKIDPANEQRLEQLHTLLDSGADINRAALDCGNTALHFAAITRNAQVFLLLLKRHADPTRVNRAGRTAWHLLATNIDQCISAHLHPLFQYLLKMLSPVSTTLSPSTHVRKTFGAGSSSSSSSSRVSFSPADLSVRDESRQKLALALFEVIDIPGVIVLPQQLPTRGRVGDYSAARPMSQQQYERQREKDLDSTAANEQTERAKQLVPPLFLNTYQVFDDRWNLIRHVTGPNWNRVPGNSANSPNMIEFETRVLQVVLPFLAKELDPFLIPDLAREVLGFLITDVSPLKPPTKAKTPEQAALDRQAMIAAYAPAPQPPKLVDLCVPPTTVDLGQFGGVFQI